MSQPDGTLLALDVDPTALSATSTRLARFGERVRYVQTYFDRIGEVAAAEHFTQADGILFDLGVSSPQFDTADRGFSFSKEAPLDMRLGPSAETTAAALVAGLPAEDLARIFWEFGDERHSRRIARRIVREREHEPIVTTTQLARIVAAARPPSRGESIHPATRVFQALRIAVNDELGRLQRALPAALQTLRGGGRLVVISFHSLEDRIVKQFMRTESRDCICPPDLPVCVCGHRAALTILTRKPLTAGAEEVAANPRARSAKLRVAERLTS
jgi:16S rRNA (cytosine1402-N4)-methyltransferase